MAKADDNDLDGELRRFRPLVEIEGRFWDPQVPDRVVRGRFVATADELTLSLEAQLRADDDPNPLERVLHAGRDDAELISGRSVFGEPLCLRHCMALQMTGGTVHHPQIWSAQEALVGVETPPQTVAGIELRVPQMRAFYGQPVFDVQQGKEGPIDTLTLNWKSSTEVTVALGEIKAVFDDEWSVSGNGSQVTLAAVPRLRLLAAEKHAPDHFEPLIEQLMTLIGLCNSGPVPIGERRLLLDDGRQARQLQRSRPAGPPASDRRRWLALGNLAPIQATVERWVALCESNTNAMGMLSEFLGSRHSVPTADRLLYLARFLEEYYRTLVAAGRIPKKKYFSQKVQQLADAYAEVLAGALGPASDEFGRAVADTRNYYTHYDENLSCKAVTGLALVILIDRLWAVIRASLLTELGFSTGRVAELMSLDNHLGWLSRQP